MKRSFAAMMLLLIPALVTSCWKTGEDWSLCGVDNNVILRFRVEDGTDPAFRAAIKDVDIYLFDAERHFLEHKKTTQSDLDIFQGVTFTVDPGIYHVVCWANVDQNSQVTAMNAASNLENTFIEIASAANGSPLYYAPYKTPVTRAANGGNTYGGQTRADDYSIYTVEVLPAHETVADLIFARAHRTVQLFVAGYETYSEYDGKAPIVEQTNAGGKYNFLLRADLAPVTLKQTTVPSPIPTGGNAFKAEFHSALIPVRGDMVVNLNHPTTGATLATINIERYIADHHITDDSVVPIMVTFSDDMNAHVSITMPSWLDNSIVPGR